MSKGRLPTFLCIGAPRSGTTWLGEGLKAHPEAFVPSTKEICFFIRDDFRSRWAKGLDWYRSQFDFPEESGIKTWGELSPRYYYQEQTPGLIREAVPDVKIIYLLRHPVEVLHSLAAYHLKMHPNVINGCGYGLFSYLDHHLAVPLGFYAKYYKRYAACFPREQILVKFYEDLKQDSTSVFSQICRFLEIDESITPPIVEQRVNPAVVPKRFWLSVLLRGLSRYWPPFAGMDRRFNRTDFKKWKGREVSLVKPEVFERLMEIYEGDVHELEELVDRDLSGWFDYEQIDPSIRSNIIENGAA